MTELILQENNMRFVLFPIQYPKTWKLYKDAQVFTWFAEEIDFSEDKIHYNNMSNDEKYFIENILAFFAAADGIVNENLMKNLMMQVQIPEIRAFYTHQIFIESIHSETYSLMINTIIEEHKRENLFKAILNIPSIKKISEWAIKWMDSDKPFSQKIIAFACVEGILFSGPFCAIYWLKKKGLLPGLSHANELISRDEGLHTDFAVHIYTDLLEHKESYETILNIFKEVVDLEIEFINESIPCKLIGINKDLMTNYIKFVADRLLTQFQYPKYWNIKNPFDWMDLMSIDTKTNFFEKRVAEYSLKKQTKETTFKHINLNDDF